ncbi:MAG: quinolinate synthase NadA [Bacteroidetes bacterium]|nr:quinolinate synthase NadA [Bacteroidota bacterium]
MEKVKQEAQRVGFVQAEVDPFLDLFAEIEQLKREKRAIILAHYYQDADIQDVADYVGDSLGLSQQAAKTDADLILFAGVHFMAETAKILNPQKKVLIPDLNAGCSLEESCPAEAFAAFKAQYPRHKVVSYINCSAELKAMSDVIVTSSNAVSIVNSFPKSQPLIFAPDKNLGAFVSKVTQRPLVLWDGACMVHEIFSRNKIVEVQRQHPAALLIAHPECEEAVLQLADFVGSTSGLLKFVQTSPAREFIVATEPGILHQMQKTNPEKQLIPAPSNQPCACNNCPHMKLNTLEKVYLTLKYEAPELEMDRSLLEAAYLPIRRMLDLSAELGL